MMNRRKKAVQRSACRCYALDFLCNAIVLAYAWTLVECRKAAGEVDGTEGYSTLAFLCTVSFPVAVENPRWEQFKSTLIIVIIE